MRLYLEERNVHSSYTNRRNHWPKRVPQRSALRNRQRFCWTGCDSESDMECHSTFSPLSFYNGYKYFRLTDDHVFQLGILHPNGISRLYTRLEGHAFKIHLFFVRINWLDFFLNKFEEVNTVRKNCSWMTSLSSSLGGVRIKDWDCIRILRSLFSI